MADKKELVMALEQLEKDKNIKKEDIVSIVENALVAAYKKHVGKNVNAVAKVNISTGEMSAYVSKEVVKDSDFESSILQIPLSEAQKIEASIKVGDTIDIPLDTQDFARIAAQTAKNVIVQRIRESERNSLFEEMSEKIGQVVSGDIYRIVNRTIIVDLGKSEAILPITEQLPKEKFAIGQRVRAVIISVRKNINKAPSTILSRKSPELIKKLFEHEVPEIYEKIVEIKDVVREPGIRAKVSVISNNPKVDPVGACVGVKGARIRPIVDELGGNERIDLIAYSDNPAKYIAAAITPAKVVTVNILSESEKRAEVLVADDMLSLAIGKNGHNVRLAAKLTGWCIDVRSESQRKQENETKVEQQIADLERLQGLGEKTIGILVKAGFTNIEKLKTLGVDDLTTLPGIGQKTAEKIIEAAKNA
ncbi:MAG: transcription termination factor NusA [Elusimicrobiota bacterium]|jgi:N utilization substance protein A|nr:transcription termination factor NusA [Elusimicrobiota bacterium]